MRWKGKTEHDFWWCPNYVTSNRDWPIEAHWCPPLTVPDWCFCWEGRRHSWSDTCPFPWSTEETCQEQIKKNMNFFLKCHIGLNISVSCEKNKFVVLQWTKQNKLCNKSGMWIACYMNITRHTQNSSENCCYGHQGIHMYVCRYTKTYTRLNRMISLIKWYNTMCKFLAVFFFQVKDTQITEIV